MTEPLNDSKILEGLKNDDHHSYSVLFETYWEMVFNLAFKKLGDKHVALDITQDVFAIIWEKRTQTNVQGAIAPWLAGIVKYKVIDWYRSSARLKDQKDSFLKTVSHDNQFQQEPEFMYTAYNNTYSFWLQSIGQLPGQMKRIYTLNSIEGRSISEIAEYLSISPQSVKNQLSKATIRIRKEMENYLQTSISITIALALLSPDLW
jgi:RNA polymerase sigma-70 factor (ECF subfamily)